MPTEIDAIIREHSVDFVDLGCSKGGSLKWAMDHLGGRRGLGIDKSAKKVALARERGMTAIVADATEIACADGAVSFTTMLHFLEHLPSAGVAAKVIAEACRISRDFVYMRHPWFGSDNELFQHGYKFFWSDWSGHPNRFGPLDFHQAIRATPNVRRWWIMGRTPIADLRHPAIVPLDAPINSFAAAPADFSRRPAIALRGPIFCEVACLVGLSDADPPLAALADHDLLSSSDGPPLPAMAPARRKGILKGLSAGLLRAARRSGKTP